MKTLARRVKTSPRITEYGSVRLTKKGWNAVSPTLGATPKPAGETQNAPAAHFVMVSGTVFSRSVEPASLQRTSLNRLNRGSVSKWVRLYPTGTRSQIHVSGKNVRTVSFFSSLSTTTSSAFWIKVLKARGTGASNSAKEKRTDRLQRIRPDPGRGRGLGGGASVAEREATVV